VSAGGDGPEPRTARSRLTIKADTLSVRQVTDWLMRLLAPAGPESAALQDRVELAIHEVCVNIVDHSYGPDHIPHADDITIEGAMDQAAVWIWMWDRGSSFDFGAVRRPVPGIPQVRGYGLVIVEQLASELHYVRENNTNIWSLRFDRAADRPESP
jgi:anti-sigma regulatory factor (Ser/Thr protein kinase)